MRRLPLVMSHLGFWLFVIAIRIPMITRVENQPYYITQLVLSMFLHIIIFYVFYLYFGKILLHKKVWTFVLIAFPFLFLYSIPVTYFFIWAFSKAMELGFVDKDPDKGDTIMVYISVFVSQSIYAILGTFFRLTIDWFKTTRRQEQLEKQNISNELALLRAQISPHFLFNTLNNLHSFAYRDQDKTAFGIIKLSEIMRYMLYEANAEKVFLEKEIKYIENYIDLQRLRLKEPTFVEFKTSGQIEGTEIAPLLLITFVENAFKHASKNVENPGISIILISNTNSLTFEVSNYIANKNNTVTSYNGFGLKNLMRRLDLIYGKNYKLDITNDGKKYSIKLELINIQNRSIASV